MSSQLLAGAGGFCLTAAFLLFIWSGEDIWSDYPQERRWRAPLAILLGSLGVAMLVLTGPQA